MGLVESVISTEPVRVGEVDLRFELWVLLGQHEGFIPLVQFDVQPHESLDVPQPQESLLGKGVVPRHPEVLRAKLNFRLVFYFV